MDQAGLVAALRGRPGAFLRSPWPWRSWGWCFQAGIAGAIMFGMGSAVVAPVATGAWQLTDGVDLFLVALMIVLFVAMAVPVGAWQRRAVRIAGYPPVISWYPLSLGPAASAGDRASERARSLARGGAILRDAAYGVLLIPLAALTLTTSFFLPIMFVTGVIGLVATSISGETAGDVSFYVTVMAAVVLMCAAPWLNAGLAVVGDLLAEWAMGIGRERAAVLAAARQASRRRLSGAFDTERKRIERDLHDGAQQRIVAQTLTLALAAEELADLGPDAAPALALVDKARAENHAILAELRDLVRAIHPQTLTDHGLAPALAEVISRFGAEVRTGIEYPTDPDERPDSLVESTAYFVVLEALSNAAKHAGARGVEVDVRLFRDWLHVLVRDRGPGGADLVPGGGLAGLADRVEAVGGTLRVSSPPGGPTIVRADIPCSPAALPLDRVPGVGEDVGG